MEATRDQRAGTLGQDKALQVRSSSVGQCNRSEWPSDDPSQLSAEELDRPHRPRPFFDGPAMPPPPTKSLRPASLGEQNRSDLGKPYAQPGRAAPAMSPAWHPRRCIVPTVMCGARDLSVAAVYGSSCENSAPESVLDRDVMSLRRRNVACGVGGCIEHLARFRGPLRLSVLESGVRALRDGAKQWQRVVCGVSRCDDVRLRNGAANDRSVCGLTQKLYLAAPLGLLQHIVELQLHASHGPRIRDPRDRVDVASDPWLHFFLSPLRPQILRGRAPHDAAAEVGGSDDSGLSCAIGLVLAVSV
ncbi:hypothetical protein OPT61_g1968 [Boeremia exigua]|uniref:Uncharacterized protein n=1 Tax=Boeremia exigua TaxID=749465 RepID=A0ACC2IN69_9PLEO|nr:hypothetical protein OPT61_g1968 [Boeremia exigua]